MTWVSLAAGALVGAALAWFSQLRPPRGLVRENHAGLPVPAVLGLALVGGAVVGHAVGRPEAEAGVLEVAAVVGLLVVFVVGVLDDLAGGGPRGLGGHLRSLASGRPTTGILKLVTGIAAGVAAAVAAGGGPLRIVAGAVVVATAVNVLNALDVVPGRSLKWGVIALAACQPAAWGTRVGSLVAAALGAAVASLPFDLGERAMLGDGGSNPLGFLVGVALLVVLPTPGLLVAAVALLALQVAAETVTISRLIEVAPPLRWLDGLGQRRRP
ncbi:MAG TPA: hypothetical protein VF058_08515 [Actinomycetota bacterium]